ncbi:MAG: alpha/beta hydrolase [bacterium]|nr:alpha/beta hydrolase [bacterium]
MKKRKNFSSFLLIILFILIFGIASFAEDGLYTAVTSDGVTLKLKRYRPGPASAYNEGRQPILLFPGIGANINELNCHTPEERKEDYADMTLPEPIADWAAGDIHIQEDPMKYYNLTHYLWLKGYDVWLANYRGIGRGEFKSDKGSKYTNLDIWIIIDGTACIDRVIEITGQSPVIGGHSTGGLMAYAYLQGVYFTEEVTLDDTYIPKVASDPVLAAERNGSIKGYIGIDPAGVPPMPGVIHDLLNLYTPWLILGTPMHMDLDTIVGDVLSPMLSTSGVICLADMVYGTMGKLDELGQDYPYWNIAGAFNNFEVANTHPYVEDFYARYALSSMYSRAFSQYCDWTFRDCAREHWKNGEENKYQIKPPAADRENGDMYCYDLNMYKMTVPAICIFSENPSLVDTQRMVKDLMEGKTAHEYDEWYEIPNTGHVDVPVGYDAPNVVYPRIGAWLDKVCPINSGTGGNGTGDDTCGSPLEGCGTAAQAWGGHSGNRPVLPGLMSLLVMMMIPLSMIFLRKRILRKSIKR